jgi:hypothetical protein
MVVVAVRACPRGHTPSVFEAREGKRSLLDLLALSQAVLLRCQPTRSATQAASVRNPTHAQSDTVALTDSASSEKCICLQTLKVGANDRSAQDRLNDILV